MASMLEVLVTSVIFIIAAFGIFSAISSMRVKGRDAEKRLIAAYHAKGKMEELRGQVDARMWDNSTSPLAPGQQFSETTSDDYTVTWSVVEDPQTQAREVTINVTY